MRENRRKEIENEQRKMETKRTEIKRKKIQRKREKKIKRKIGIMRKIINRENGKEKIDIEKKK